MPALPADVQVLSEGAVTRLIFPERPRASRVGGCMVIVFGLFFAGSAVFWISGVLGFGRHGAVAPFQWFSLGMALFGVPFVIAGLIPVGIGVLMFLPSHSEIAISTNELIAIEQMGPIRYRRRRPIGQIQGLRVGQGFMKPQQSLPAASDAVSTAGSSGSYGLIAEIAATPGKALGLPLRLAGGYPREMLAAVGEFLVEELRTQGSISLLRAETFATSPSGLSLAIDPEPAGTVVAEERALSQPEGSKISFVPAPDSLTFIIPHSGFRGAALFFLMFSLFWNAVSFIVVGAFTFQLIKHPSLASLGLVGFGGIFIAIGVGMFLAGIQTAFRKSVLLATRDSLVFTQTGPIRKAEYEWAPGELAAIRCDNSGTEINNRPLKQLQIHASGAKRPAKRGLLTGRDDDELFWIASALRAFYHVRSK